MTFFQLLLYLFLASTVVRAESLESVTLELAQTQARTHNPDLKTIRRGIAVALGERRIAGTRPYNPELEASVTSDRTFSGEGEKELELGLSQVFETGGKRGFRTRIADIGLERARLAFQDKQRTLAGEVALAFYKALYFQERLALNEQALALASEIHSVARRRLKAGDIAELDASLALAAREKRAAEAAAIAADLTAARVALVTLMGTPARAIAAVSGTWSLPTTWPSEPALLAAALDSRADLRGKRLDIDVAQGEEKLARAGRSPDVTLGVAYSKDRGIFDEQSGVPRLVDSDRLLTLRASVPLPIVNRKTGEIEKARALQQEALSAAETLTQEVQKQILEARRRLSQAAERHRIYRDRLLPVALQNLELNRTAYQAGQLELLVVLKAQDDLNEARFGQLEAAWDYQQAQIVLETSIGRSLPGSQR